MQVKLKVSKMPNVEIKEIYYALLEVKLKSNTTSVSMDAFQRVLIVLGLLESMSEVLQPVFIQMKNFQRKIVMRSSDP